MYKITKDGDVIAYAEKLNYIKQKENGVFVSCTEKEAQGVAVNNTAYNIAGRQEMTGCETVAIFDVDIGEYIQHGEECQTETDALVIDHEYRITLLELGVNE